MLKVLTILTVLVSFATAKVSYCGPDNVICKYESMYATYQERTKVFPMGKPVLSTLLIELFDGKALKSQMAYVQTLNEDMVEAAVLFLDPIKNIDRTEILEDGSNRKVIKRTFTTSLTAHIGSEEVPVRQTLIYTITKKYSSWKISEIQTAYVD